MIPDKLLEQIFIIFYQLTNSYGTSIIFLSLAVTIIMLPLFLFAEILQDRERTRKKAMQPDLDEIKDLENKQEKYYYTKEIYKKNNYKTYYALTGLIGFAIQVPFFIAAYWMLLGYTPLEGVPFGLIKDLSRPDGLITIGGNTLNLLPFIMTIINLFAGYLYSKKMDKSEQIQLILIASVFLVLLYNLSAALILYWTMNNVFAIGKNWFISNINFKYHGPFPLKQTSKKQVIIHPFLFAIYPIVFLASHNIHEIYLKEAFIPILIALFISSIVTIFSKFLSFNMHKTGLVLTSSWILFFSFTPIIFLLQMIQSYVLINLRIRYLYILLIGIPFITLILYVIKTNKNFFKTTNFLNILGIVLIIIPLTNICYNSISFSKNNYTYSGELFDSEINIEANYPDIYYIVLDGYARADILKDVYNYNNQPFLDKMKSIGFDVASQSYANYVQTSLSLPSSINMEYVHLNMRNSSKHTMQELIQNNNLTKFLKRKGYIISEISNGWGSSTSVLPNPDENYEVGPSMLTSFQITLVKNSFLVLLNDIIKDNRYSYDRVLDSFDWLTSMPKVSEPRFIFAHIVSPHSPFLFRKNGERIPIGKFSESINTYDDKKAYIEQLIFINRKVEIAIEEIIDHSTVPPIIIIQSDHGTSSKLGLENTTRNWDKPNKAMIKERAANLTMYYLPCAESGGFYNSISPVNIFRAVFNSCFNSNLELLPDSLYWSWYEKPPVFTNVTDSIP